LVYCNLVLHLFIFNLWNLYCCWSIVLFKLPSTQHSSLTSFFGFFIISGNRPASIDTSYSWSEVTEILIWSSFQKLAETSYWYCHFRVSFGLPFCPYFFDFEKLETSVFSCHSMASKWTNHLNLQKLSGMYTINPIFYSWR
jgi:hypothetical protein